MTVQVFRKGLNASESPALLTLGLFGHHGCVAKDDAPALYLLIKKA
jgi:hypothetical protein